MKTLTRLSMSSSLRVACGVAVLVATSAIAQESRAVKPDATNPAVNPNESHAPVSTQPSSTQNRPTTAAPQSDQFSSMDTDKDGKIFVAEYTNATMEAFKSMDKDSDGKISGVELTEGEYAASGSPSPLSSAQLSSIDTNKDVQITAKEMSSGAARMFKNLDVNADGFLSENELDGRQYRSDTEASADSRSNTASNSSNSAAQDPQAAE
jgi:hypothetical protein